MNKTEFTLPTGVTLSGFEASGVVVVLSDKAKGVWLVIHRRSNTVLTFARAKTQAAVKSILAELTFFLDWDISSGEILSNPEYLKRLKAVHS